MQKFGRLPGRDESVELDGYLFTVLSADGRTIRLLRVTPPGENQDATATEVES